MLTINKLLQFATKVVLSGKNSPLDLHFKIGRHAMRASVGSSIIPRLPAVAAALWFSVAGSAWAGDGGDDAGPFQPFLQLVCDLVGATSCPLMPTLTQVVLGISDLQNTPPDFVRGPLGNFAGLCSVSGNPLRLCSEFNAVSTVNPLAPSSIALSGLPNLTPLAFKATPGLAATPVALGSEGANSFVYPVLTGPDGQHALDVVFDYTPWTSTSFSKGQAVGSFTFPLVMLNADNSETPVVATLNLTATCNGAVAAAPGCLAGTVTGIPGTGTNPPPTAAQLGINFAFQLAASPNSSRPHAIITFQLPVIVTQATDPVYFGVDSSGTSTFINQFSGQPTAFSKNDLGFTPTSLGASLRLPIGVAPTPAPLCSDPNISCPPPNTATHFGFCATIGLTPAAGTFISLGTEGTAYASSPVPESGTLPQCP
jgi:hypothetical protein